MRRWQRLARAGVGLFVVGFAVAVYLAIKQRAPSPEGSSVPRVDPKAIAESTGGVSQLAKGIQQDYAIEYRPRPDLCRRHEQVLGWHHGQGAAAIGA